MRNHIKIALELDLKCEECDHEFCDFRTYERHMKENHYHDIRRTKPFVCADCGDRFITQKTLSMHQAAAKRLNLSCEMCNLTFCNTRQKHQHDLKHHSLSTDDIWKCPECSKLFKRPLRHTKYFIRRHIWTHHPTMCTRCYKVFGSVNELKEHQLYNSKCAELSGSKVKAAVENTTDLGDFLLRIARPKPDAIITSRHDSTRAKKTSKKADTAEIESDIEAVKQMNDLMQKLNKR